MAPSVVKVGILGATGTVGQKFISLLKDHPFLKISALGASARSAGRPYHKAVRWKLATPIPEAVVNLIVQECKPQFFSDCDIVFSGLDADVAGEIELAFCAAELPIFSNSKNHRRGALVPLVVPHVNVSHLSVIPHQRALHAPPLRKGFIVTNANCSVTVLTVPLIALEKAFGPIDTVIVTTMQAISGAGYPGVPSMDILDNVVPYIGGEEEKMEWEALKILGGVQGIDAHGKIVEGGEPGFDMRGNAPIKVSASCNRVPVLEGHTECVSVRFKNRPPPSPEAVEKALASYISPVADCPSAPKQAIRVFSSTAEPDRPQPRLDRDFERGAGVSVGRVRECGVLDTKFVVMGSNTSIGAAMSSILNAEWSIANGIIVV